MDPLSGIDPKLLQHLKQQGVSREDIIKNVGVQQVIDGAEAKRVLDQKVERMRSPQMDDQLRQQITAGIEQNKDRLLATTNPAELKLQLREIALASMQKTQQSVVAASAGSGTSGDRG